MILSEKKDKKRIESLAVATDGLDVLLGIEREEGKEEKVEERRPVDSFSGMLQSMIPLMILPQILPLFQQAFGQTLRETTVNVKVESATSIIPIDITAQTAILAVDIRAQSVTLNIRIIESTTVLNVVVQGSASIVITGQSVDVRISGFYQAVAGFGKRLVGYSHIPDYDPYVILEYTVPSGKRLVITNFKANVGISFFGINFLSLIRYPTSGWNLVYQYKPEHVEFYIEHGTTSIYMVTANVSSPTITEDLPTPLVFTAGSTIRVSALSNVPGVYVWVEVNGYEEVVT